MKNKSAFEKYSWVSREIVLTAIETMTANQRMILKKGYGPEYDGKGYLLSNEIASFELADNLLEARIKDVFNLFEAGKTKQEILDLYQKKNSASIVSIYSDKKVSSIVSTGLNKLPDEFIDFFHPSLHKIVIKMLPQLLEEEKELIHNFYWGANFNILKKENLSSQKITELNLLVSKIKVEALRKMKQKRVIPNVVTKKEYSQEKTDNEPLIGESKIDKPKVSTKDTLTKERKSHKRKGIVKKSFLEHFDVEQHELVLRIVKRFEVTNLNYYKAITMKYSGERYEIVNDVDLEQDKVTLNNAKSRIKQLLKFPKDKLAIFLGEEVSSQKEDLKVVYQEQPILEEKKEEVLVKEKVSKETKEVQEEKEKAKKGTGAKGLLEFFDEDKHELVLKIVSKIKKVDPIYRYVIRKEYTGERYEISKGVLTKEENRALNSVIAKIRTLLQGPKEKLNAFLGEEVISKVELKTVVQEQPILEEKNEEILVKEEAPILKDEVSEEPKEKVKTKIKKAKKEKLTKGLLEFFDEDKQELVLKIVTKLKTTNPNYHDVIIREYTGERYETATGTLTKEENIVLNSARAKIRTLLQGPKEKLNAFLGEEVISKVELKTVVQEQPLLEKKSEGVLEEAPKETNICIDSIQSILSFVPNKSVNDLLLSNIIKNKKDILRIMSMDEIVDCYIDNLNCFDEQDAVMIIKIVAIYQPSKIEKIINSSYFKDKMQYLTFKEQEYIYLTLLSYTKAFLTPEKISEMLDIDHSILEEYQIMTSHDDVNVFNKLWKNI